MIKEKLPLTIIILTHINDSRFIASLKSAQIAKNTIVVDNNSHNDWRKLSRHYNFKLISHENTITNFAKIRNEALVSVRTDWVLFLDSDESLGDSFGNLEKNKKNIKKIIDDDLFDGVTITRRDIFHKKPLKFGEAGNLKLIRMFKTKKGKFVRNIHEFAKISGKLGDSEIIISHFSHFNISSFLQTINNYAKMASKNERSSWLGNLLKMILYPPLKFIQNYFFKFGFLDGYRGIIYAIMMSLHSLFVRIFYFEEYFTRNNDSEN